MNDKIAVRMLDNGINGIGSAHCCNCVLMCFITIFLKLVHVLPHIYFNSGIWLIVSITHIKKNTTPTFTVTISAKMSFYQKQSANSKPR